MKKIVKAGKSDDFTVNLDDARFSAFKTSHHFAIDPSAPEYKETKETHKLREAQAAAMSRDITKTKDVQDSGSVIDKIKNRTAELKNKKDNSKLFKTKNKGYIPINTENDSSNVDNVKPKKKRKLGGTENVKPDKVKKKKKKKATAS